MIIYLRRQDSLLEAHYAQKVKQELETRDINEFIEQIPKWNYWNFLESSKEIFRPARIIVRPYEKNQLKGGDIISDFLDNVFGINNIDEFFLSKNDSNPRLGRDILEFKLLLNRIVADLEIVNRLLPLLLKYSMSKKSDCREPISDHHLLSPQQRFEIIKRNKDVYKKIAVNYLGRNDGNLFFEDLPDVNEKWVPYNGLSPVECMRIISELNKNIYDFNKVTKMNTIFNELLVRTFKNNCLNI